MSEGHATLEFREAARLLDSQFSETALAKTMLAALDALDAGVLDPESADEVFTALDIRLTDSPDAPPLSEEAQELIFEGEHLHHTGDEYGPDPSYLRRQARAILARA